MMIRHGGVDQIQRLLQGKNKLKQAYINFMPHDETSWLD